MPIIDLQRRLVQVGRIRMGTSEARERQGGGTYKVPVPLAHWRLTSRDPERLEAAAAAYGGEVVPWDGHDGEYELLIETVVLPVAVLPGQNISLWYELWGKRKQTQKAPIECLRRCDGQIESLTDMPCSCDPDDRDCKPRTRLSVLLTDIPGIGCWRFDSSGYYAAIELSGTAELLEACTAAGRPYPARLRIDKRRQVKDGETVTFPVPVLDIATTLGEALATLGGGPAALPQVAAPPPGHTPLPELEQGAGVGLGEGLAAAAAQAAPKVQSARSAEPIGAPAIAPPVAPAPLPIDDEDSQGGENASAEVMGAMSKEDAEAAQPELRAEGPPEPPAAPEPDVRKPTAPMIKKLNVLVGQLRDGGHITTELLYAAMAASRNLDPAVMTEVIEDAKDEKGVLHWKPLRDTLNRGEAHNLIDRLEKLQTKLNNANDGGS